MKIISVVNQKGGSGKTSFSVLACRALAEKGHRVLAIDCDPQGGISQFLMKRIIDGNITDILMGNLSFPFFTSYDHIHILTADYKLDKIYVTLDHLAFKRFLKMVNNNYIDNYFEYDYIIFDTPPTMQGITRAAIHISDKIFVPCELSKSALNPTLYTLECVKEMEKKAGVVFIQPVKETTGHLAIIEKEFIKNLDGQWLGSIRRDLTSQKIVSGDQELTENKIEKYLDPVYRLIVGYNILILGD
jgi:chromosome partitioning protein